MSALIDRPLGDDFGLIKFVSLIGHNIYGTFIPMLTTLKQIRLTLFENYACKEVKVNNIKLALEYMVDKVIRELDLNKESDENTLIDIYNKHNIENNTKVAKTINIRQIEVVKENREEYPKMTKEFRSTLYYQIFVRTLTGATRTISCNTGMTVLNVKELIHEKTDIHPNDQRLIYSGEQLRDDYKVECENTLTEEERLEYGKCIRHKTKNSYKFTSGCTLHLCLRLRAGMFHETSGKEGNYGTLKECVFAIEPDIIHKVDNDNVSTEGNN